jgi:hypothetical protein
MLTVWRADIVADHLARALAAGNDVVMRKPPIQFTMADYKPSLTGCCPVVLRALLRRRPGQARP